MKLGDMNDRELILFVIGEVRYIKNAVTNHLAHHQKQDDRRWKLHVGLLLAFVAIAGSLFIALVT